MHLIKETAFIYLSISLVFSLTREFEPWQRYKRQARRKGMKNLFLFHSKGWPKFVTHFSPKKTEWGEFTIICNFRLTAVIFFLTRFSHNQIEFHFVPRQSYIIDTRTHVIGTFFGIKSKQNTSRTCRVIRLAHLILPKHKIFFKNYCEADLRTIWFNHFLEKCVKSLIYSMG